MTELQAYIKLQEENQQLKDALKQESHHREYLHQELNRSHDKLLRAEEEKDKLREAVGKLVNKSVNQAPQVQANTCDQGSPMSATECKIAGDEAQLNKVPTPGDAFNDAAHQVSRAAVVELYNRLHAPQ